MNARGIPPGGVDLHHARVLITDTRLILPNQVEVRPNGLDAGNSVAYLALTAPATSKQWRAPLLREQLLALRDQCWQVLDELDKDQPER